jgi:DNA-binding transcriptional LysR family regulator
MNLSGVNLNLLVAFVALLDEGSVTRAGLRSGLSQPAMSSALRRLREMFGDPLFVRTPRGLSPTPRALQLDAPVRRTLEQIGDLFQLGVPFDPSSAAMTFALATTDYGSIVVLPRLLQRLKTVAPGVSLNVRALRALDLQAAFQRGDLDLAVTWRLEPSAFEQAAFYTRALFDERLVCIVRADHPSARRRLTLARFTAMEHVVVSPSEEFQPIVDVVLAQHRLRRRVAVVVPHFVAAPFVVSGTDFVATVPEQVARSLAATLRLRILKPPVLLPAVAVRLVWHERTHTNPAHVWFRELVTNLYASPPRDVLAPTRPEKPGRHPRPR